MSVKKVLKQIVGEKRLSNIKGEVCHYGCLLYHDYRMRGEQRCDLHPSVEDDGRYVAVDTTYHGGRRSIVILKNSVEEIK